MSPTLPLTPAALRQFGLVLGTLIALIFGLFLPWSWSYSYPYWPWGVLLGLGGVALVAPLTLIPVQQGWMRLGLALGAVNGRIILGVVFYGLITPLGIVMRSLGVDPLHLRRVAQPGRSGQGSYRTLAVPRAKQHFTRPF
jgi:hypothetical protein